MPGDTNKRKLYDNDSNAAPDIRKVCMKTHFGKPGLPLEEQIQYFNKVMYIPFCVEFTALECSLEKSIPSVGMAMPLRVRRFVSFRRFIKNYDFFFCCCADMSMSGIWFAGQLVVVCHARRTTFR